MKLREQTTFEKCFNYLKIWHQIAFIILLLRNGISYFILVWCTVILTLLPLVTLRQRYSRNALKMYFMYHHSQSQCMMNPGKQYIFFYLQRHGLDLNRVNVIIEFYVSSTHSPNCNNSVVIWEYCLLWGLSRPPMFIQCNAIILGIDSGIEQTRIFHTAQCMH